MAAKSEQRNQPHTAKKRGRGFQSAGATVRAAVDQLAGRKGFAETEVLLRWPEIAGSALAAVCRPVKVHYGASRAMGATLIVQTDSGRAPEVEHQGPALVERVNQFYGYRAIRRLKVTQSTGLGSSAGKAQGFAEEQAAFDGPASNPTPEEEKRAAQMAQEIETPGLKDALSRMGAHVLAQSRTNPRDH
ncbi:MAG: DUF721 domain-containing protein [Pseudomonadota bacterium]